MQNARTPMAMRRAGISILFVVFLFVGCRAMYAQDDGLSTSIAPPIDPGITASDQQQGLDSVFNASTSNLANPEPHAGINDPLHSNLETNSLSPLVSEQVLSGTLSNPLTKTITDSTALVGVNDFGFGQRSRSFVAGAVVSGRIQTAGAEVGSQTQGVGAMRAAFTVSQKSSNAFSGDAVGASEPPGPYGAGSETSASGPGNETRGRAALSETDPILSGSTAGYEVSLQLDGDMPTPSSETAGFFAEAPGTAENNFAYDDGQTPGIGLSGSQPGTIIGTSPEYSVATNGFPDSTRGTAAIPTEASNATTPFAEIFNGTGSPFPAVSEGTVFGVHTGVNPDLHAMASLTPVTSFHAYERHLQEERIIHGVSITNAAEVYQQDLRSYQKNIGRQQRKSTLTPEITPTNPYASMGNLGNTQIR